ncbi:MAG: AI-2E family transporter [Actinomycetes bacterium]|jgi:predicted PurR-regulated permease PerM|nr:AI-2E family transporter [Actinomycetes bacterium]
MSPSPKPPAFSQFRGVPRWLIIGGVNAGLLLLLGLAMAAALYLVKLSATISVPLIIAVVVAIIAYPLMRLGDRAKLPRPLSAALVLLVLAALAWAAIQITLSGVVSQAPAIGKQLATGASDLIRFINDQLASFHLSGRIDLSPAQIGNTLQDFASTIRLSDLGAGGTAGSVASGLASGFTGLANLLSGAFGVVFGCFIGLCCLYYFLTDYEGIMTWVGDHIGQNQALGEGIIDDAARSLRGYFKSTTITALIVDVAIGIGLWILGVPLVIPILIVTFLTAYIPFFGAIISSLFACLIALGNGGPVQALIVLAIVIVAQNLLQSVVINRLMGDSLNLHPLVVLISTMLGSTFGGLLGAALAAPAVSIALCSYHRIQKHADDQPKRELAPPPSRRASPQP